MDDIFPYISSITTRIHLNACIFFLQITFLSKISAININHLIQGILHRDNSKISSTTLHWPKQGSPDSSAWKILSKVIKYLYCIKYHSVVLRKENKLGQWLISNYSRT